MANFLSSFCIESCRYNYVLSLNTFQTDRRTEQVYTVATFEGKILMASPSPLLKFPNHCGETLRLTTLHEVVSIIFFYANCFQNHFQSQFANNSGLIVLLTRLLSWPMIVFHSLIQFFQLVLKHESPFISLEFTWETFLYALD